VIDSFLHCYSRIYGFVLPLWRDQIFDRVFELIGSVLILKRALSRFLFIVNSLLVMREFLLLCFP